MHGLRALSAAIEGVLAVLVVVLAALSTPHNSSLSEIRFDGIMLDITYLNDSPQLFGSMNQNACNQTLLVPPGPPLRPDCPSVLVEGNSYDFEFFWTGNAGASKGLWTNFTVSAPFPIDVDPGTAGHLQTTYSAGTGLYMGGANMLFDLGEWLCSVLVFTMPTDFHPLPLGLWLNATLSVQPTNQTYGP